MNEQRTHRRQRVLKAATIAFNGAGIDCVVRNISATGAALEVESPLGIPPEFNLVISAERFSERCRVLWRKQKRIGVVFEPGPSAHDAPPLAPVMTAANPVALPRIGAERQRADAARSPAGEGLSGKLLIERLRQP